MAGEDSFPCNHGLATPIEDGIILGRADDGSAITNVPRLVVEHSPTGFEFGYGGSGPADLALNIVEIMLRRMDYQGEEIQCFDGRCFSLSRRLCYDFKWEFIATVPREGAVIPYGLVEVWVRERMGSDGQDQASAS